LRKIPIEDVREFSEEKYEELIPLLPELQSFNIFILSKNLGIAFRPEDLTIDQLYTFSEIESAVSQHFKEKK
jgi:hypothetical protein